MTWSVEVEKAYERSKQVRSRAYAPYSRFLVGCCLKAEGHAGFFCGCNVENVSYGATICAERSAIVSAASALGGFKIQFMVLVTDSQPVAVPCGMCLQVISEFSDARTEIYLANLQGIQKKVLLKDLLPLVFDKRHLPNS